MKKVKLYGALILLILAACTSAINNIHLEKVSATSDLLTCDKIFSISRDSIVQLNQIMIQTGVVDTSDATPFKASVINVDGQELILNLVKADKKDDHYKEQYAGKGYKLLLDYNRHKLGSSIIYKGDCELWHGKEHSKMEIEGMDNNL